MILHSLSRVEPKARLRFPMLQLIMPEGSNQVNALPGTTARSRKAPPSKTNGKPQSLDAAQNSALFLRLFYLPTPLLINLLSIIRSDR
jgi:hypothetical protein